MAIKPKRTGGGWAAIRYSLRLAGRAGYWKTWKAMQSRNACKTCAVGMGGQSGGMRNEAGHWPEVCKKSFQAMVADMQGAIKPEFFAKYGVAELRTLSPRELEHCGRLATPLLLKRGGTHYQPIAWDEALGMLAQSLREAPPEKSLSIAPALTSRCRPASGAVDGMPSLTFPHRTPKGRAALPANSN